MDFGIVLQALRGGKRARRPYMAEGTFIYLVSGSTFEVSRLPLNAFYPNDFLIKYHPHIDIAYPDGSCGVWPMPQADVLADDWEILERA
jgi:hypothetical protein